MHQENGGFGGQREFALLIDSLRDKAPAAPLVKECRRRMEGNIQTLSSSIPMSAKLVFLGCPNEGE